ncbi:hypothetical protein GCG54_00014620 [Colletotrichum gloeosporioides]|uniref:F-box domain-containing protein n=1 Tax=Colletotrichum gloeosporioides TaxID=474922 RepID=A0A8H4FDA1_COLGL|nr:uncharacterized protein GCG54_00014620 [Colletotrichum gloeosporioides]KAF3797721.1 hypothetical protein GCG54_00014620 [Colletotrichum gloeosporioides]
MKAASPIPGLPFEIVLAIVGVIQDVSTLSAVSQTCHDLYEAASPLLYRNGLARDDTEVQSSINIHTNYDIEETPRDYTLKPYANPIVLWAAAADPVVGLPVLEKVLSLRPLHLWATFHLPGHTCEPHWPWTTNTEEPLSAGRITSLHVAASVGNFAAVYWLLEDHLSRSTLGLEVTATYACMCPSSHLNILRQNHGLLDAEDCPDATPLHLALAHGHIDVARLLILCGANWSGFTDGCHGVTGLMMIASNGQVELLKWLFDNGLLTKQAVEHEDNMGFTAEDYVCSCDSEVERGVMKSWLTEIRTGLKIDMSLDVSCGISDLFLGKDESSPTQKSMTSPEGLVD